MPMKRGISVPLMQTLDQLNQELETAITLAEQTGLQDLAKKADGSKE